MTNLIPQTAKHKVAKEYWTRVVSIWVFILSGIFIIAGVLLIPVNVIINNRIDIYSGPAQEAVKDVTEYDLSSSVLIKSSARAGLIMKLDEKDRFSRIVKLIESLTNAGVKIDNFDFSRTDTGISPIAISGHADTRQTLAEFREILLSSDEIEDVLLPISNLARDKDITFNVTVTMKGTK